MYVCMRVMSRLLWDCASLFLPSIHYCPHGITMVALLFVFEIVGFLRREKWHADKFGSYDRLHNADLVHHDGALLLGLGALGGVGTFGILTTVSTVPELLSILGVPITLGVSKAG